MEEIKSEESNEQINWRLMKIWVEMCEDWNMRLALMNHSLRMENFRLVERIKELENKKR